MGLFLPTLRVILVFRVCSYEYQRQESAPSSGVAPEMEKLRSKIGLACVFSNPRCLYFAALVQSLYVCMSVYLCTAAEV